jgi:hypothetical protein
VAFDAFLKLGDGTTARGVNVRAFETLTGRARGGSRAGLTKFIDEQVVP